MVKVVFPDLSLKTCLLYLYFLLLATVVAKITTTISTNSTATYCSFYKILKFTEFRHRSATFWIAVNPEKFLFFPGNVVL